MQRADIQARSGPLVKEWCPKACGQGHDTANKEKHHLHRYEILCRLKVLSEAYGHRLPRDHEKRWEAFVVWWDEMQRKRLPVPSGIGEWIVQWAKDLQKRMNKDPKAFVRWVESAISLMPAAKLTL